MNTTHRAAGVAATFAILSQVLGPISTARAADPVVVTFSSTGAEQSWVVPDGVSSVSVVLVGGSGTGASFVGGRGHRIAGDLAVTAGSTLYIEVGGNGAAIQGGFNGGGGGGSGTSFNSGGGGGGATDLRTLPSSAPGSLGSRLIVAAGGGGNSPNNSGGDAGQPGGGTRSGGAGTSTAGGALGVGSAFGYNGFAGELANGGLGGHIDPFSSGYGAGGGGGGYYGGGGGGASTTTNAGAGGGGSSYTGSATGTSVTFDSSATPSLAITYTLSSDGSASGTVSAIVTMATSAVCLELSTTSVDFGTRRFGETGAAAAPFIDVTNCGGIDENILVRGTDATGPGSSAWSLVSFGACETGVLGMDKFRMRLAYVASPDVYAAVTTENTQLDSLGPDDTVQHEAQIDTPCPGSTGAGESMSMQILFTAIEEAAP